MYLEQIHSPSDIKGYTPAQRRALAAEKLDAKIVLQIHDELVIDASVSDGEKVKKLLKNEMEAAYNLKTGLIANPQSGENLYDI